MYYARCCAPGCETVGSAHTEEEILRLTYKHEAECPHNREDGGYAIYIWQNSRIVGSNVDGITGPIPDGPPPYDHATATGMYDRY